MNLRYPPSTSGVLTVFILLTFSPISSPEDRPLASGTPIDKLMEKPSTYQDPEWIYSKYFSLKDTLIEQKYYDSWKFHESRVNFSGVSWRYEHFRLGTLDYFGEAPYEGSVRGDFASFALRVRIDAALQKYLERSEWNPKLQRFKETLNHIKDYRVPIGSESTSLTQWQWRIGYDVINDESKIEYGNSIIGTGFYHPRFAHYLFGPEQPSEVHTRISLSNPAGISSESWLKYHFSDQLFETGVSKPLMPNTRAAVITSRMFKSSEWRHEIQIFYELLF